MQIASTQGFERYKSDCSFVHDSGKSDPRPCRTLRYAFKYERGLRRNPKDD